VNRADRVRGERLGEKVVWQMLQAYAAAVGVPGITPHDLRRTCAKLCRAAGGELEQIQLLLGHHPFKQPSAISARNRIWLTPPMMESSCACPSETHLSVLDNDWRMPTRFAGSIRWAKRFRIQTSFRGTCCSRHLEINGVGRFPPLPDPLEHAADNSALHPRPGLGKRWYGARGFGRLTAADLAGALDLGLLDNALGRGRSNRPM